MIHKKYNIDLGAGYTCIDISIAMIGICTAVIGDVAGHLGCFIYLKDSVNAIAFVALGTSVPGKKKKLLRNVTSRQKIKYVRALALADVDFDALAAASTEEVVGVLT